VLRKGKTLDKLAILYEVVAENTSEENTSRRRRQTPALPAQQQLKLLTPSYPVIKDPLPRAAEGLAEWQQKTEESTD
jgi:hypothetical protein